MEYRKKPIVIKAVQYDGNFRCLDIFGISEVWNFIVSKDEEGNECIKIPTLEGEMIASIGDYIIRGVKGEFYPCKPDIFEMTYELASTLPQQETMYKEDTCKINGNTYITNEEEIKKGDWFLEKAGRQYPIQWNGKEKLNFHCKKIILTTDQDLINDGAKSLKQPKKD